MTRGTYCCLLLDAATGVKPERVVPFPTSSRREKERIECKGREVEPKRGVNCAPWHGSAEEKTRLRIKR